MRSVTDPALDLSIVRRGAEHALLVRAGRAADLEPFEGTAAGAVLEGPLSARNAAAVRSALPWLRPSPVGLHTSVGTGDRLGLATAGHARAFRHHGEGVRPVFAQQSIREMSRLGREPREVIDDATFGCVQAGWSGPVGADADHLKTTDDIARCLDAGFTTFTLDIGDHLRRVTGAPTPGDLAAVPWSALEDDPAAARRRYEALRVDLGDCEIRVAGDDLDRAIATYGPAVAAGAALHRYLVDHADGPFEVEIAVDETHRVTSPAEHVYLATELARLGVRWVSLAPCHPGGFEKGVEFRGDAAALRESIATHARIAAALGPYKIGVHSGSDKFSIYRDIAEATDGLVHLKTSGSSYLVALDVAAAHEPDLLRRIYAVSRDAYLADRASYPVSADASGAPDPRSVPDGDLVGLLAAPTTRQILHVGYGSVLRRPDGGPSELDTALRVVLLRNEDDYHARLESHLGRHIGPFAKGG